MVLPSRGGSLLGALGLVLGLLACGGGGGGGKGGVEAPPLAANGPVDASTALLSEQEKANALAFVRLQGLVRHFHPSDEAAAADWKVLSAEGMRAALRAGTPSELRASLEASFAPVAPTVQVFFQQDPPPLPPALRPPAGGSSQFIHWRHQGWGFNNLNPNPYSSERLRAPTEAGLPPGWDAPSAPFEADLGQGLRARVPLTLYLVVGATVPAATAQAPYRAYKNTTAADRPTRLATVGLAWNLWQHHFPYFEQVGCDWGAALPRILAEAALASGAADLGPCLQHLLHELQDGHGSCSFPEDPGASRPGLVLDWVEDRWIVARLPEGPVDGVQLGDEILSVDGQDVGVCWEAFQRRQTGSPGWIRDRGRRELLAGPSGSSVDLALRHVDGSLGSARLRRSAPKGSFRSPAPEARDAVVREVEPGILYVDLDQLTADQYQANLPRFQAARGLVCDLRGYVEAGAYSLMANLLDGPIGGIRLSTPVALHPDRQGLSYQEVQWTLAPQPPRLGARAVFLTDGRAISQAESFLGYVECVKDRYPLVGAPSAGADGNVSAMDLPGGFHVTFTGMTVLKPDGSQLFLRGYTPTHPTFRTVRGVAQGRDELLEKAIALLRASEQP